MRPWPLLIIGQAPSMRATPGLEAQEALAPDGEGTSADRLLKLFGCSAEAYMATTERVNLIKQFPGRDGKGDVFDASEAITAASYMWTDLRHRRTLIVGTAVAWAFGIKGPKLTWNQEFHGLVAWVPHTSGVNRWWNSAENRAAAEAFMRPLGEEMQNEFEAQRTGGAESSDVEPGQDEA